MENRKKSPWYQGWWVKSRFLINDITDQSLNCLIPLSVWLLTKFANDNWNCPKDIGIIILEVLGYVCHWVVVIERAVWTGPYMDI